MNNTQEEFNHQLELEKIISLDKILNLKIASENTYYKD